MPLEGLFFLALLLGDMWMEKEYVHIASLYLSCTNSVMLDSPLIDWDKSEQVDLSDQATRI